MIAQTQEACGRRPGEFSLDAGYNRGRDLVELEEQGIKAYVGDTKDPIKTPEAREAVRAVREGNPLSLPQIGALPVDPNTKRWRRCGFAYQAATDSDRCPAGQTLTLHRRGRRDDRSGGLERKRDRMGACGACPLASRCCKDPGKGREISRTEFEGGKERMKERMTSDDGKRRYQLRGQSVEPRIGTLKSVLGMRKFLRRGREKVGTEWRWACTAFNVGVLIRRWAQTRTVLG